MFRVNEIFVSEVKESSCSAGTLVSLAYPYLMRTLEAGLTNRALREGIVYTLGMYKIRATMEGISRAGNIKFFTELETPDGQKLFLGDKLLSQAKFEKLTSTVLYGVKDIIREYEKLIKEGESPEVAILIANAEGDENVKRRVSFVRSHPELGWEIESVICPNWSYGVVPINQISLSGYNETIIANAISFIGEPEEPAQYSLEYKTREGAEKPWAIELKYSTPKGGGCYWLYLDGATADAHNGNLETLSACGSFEQYRGLLWMFLNPIREKIAEFKKNFC